MGEKGRAAVYYGLGKPIEIVEYPVVDPEPGAILIKITRANICGSQVLPHVYRYFDTHDIAGLIAPRPLLIEMGVHDTCFPIEAMLEGFEGVRRIYEAAGAGDRLWADVHPGEHAFAGNKVYDFFEQYL